MRRRTCESTSWPCHRWTSADRPLSVPVGAGGRYDGLIELLGGPHTPGVGFATGIERIVLNLRERGAIAPDLSTDYSRGIAITSSWHPDEHTHVEPVRYGKGSNLMALLQTEEKDRHVVAAALKAGCPLILTFNLRHFRPEHLEPLGLRASHPDEYLVVLYELDPRQVAATLGEMAGRAKMDTEDLLIKLGRVIPKFAAKALDDLGK